MDYTEIPTDRKGVWLFQGKKEWEVEISGDKFVYQGKESLCREILKPFAESLSIDIEMSNPHGEAAGPILDRRLHVFIRSVPENCRKVTRDVQIFGVHTEGAGEDACEPSGKGFVVRSPEGVPVAEVLEKNIYVLFDVMHQPAEICEHHLRETLELAVPLALEPESPEAREILQEMAAREKQAYKNAYVLECARRLKQELQRAKESIPNIESNLGEYSEKIVQSTRELELKEKHLKILKTGLSRIEPEISKEFEILWQTRLGKTIITALAGFNQKRKEVLQKLYTEKNKNWIEQEVSEVDNGIALLRDDLQNFSEKIIKGNWQLEQYQKRIKELSLFGEETRERFGKEFDKLCTLSGVGRVEVIEGEILVFTEEITIEYQGENYKIGHFRISLNTEDGEIKCFNLNRRLGHDSNRFDHPHISRGEPCLGNVKEGLAKLMGSYEYAVAIQIILDWLRSYNDEGAYKDAKIREWPIKTGDKEK